jgi:hypothetical protein
VARRGARSLIQPERDGPSASEVWRDAAASSGRTATFDEAQSDWGQEEIWTLVPSLEEEQAQSEPAQSEPARPGRTAWNQRLRDVATGREGIPSPGGHQHEVPRPVVDELGAMAAPGRAAKLAARMADATYAYERERYQDARRILRALANEVPQSAAVRELYGLVLYRTGRWRDAVTQLEKYRQLSGSFDQHPVLADCYRALRRYDDAETIWEELKAASPTGDLVAEGRIVAAGCRAEQGDLTGAIALLERSGRRVSRPQSRHLRQWYALADFNERAGNLPRARELFSRIEAAEPDAFDVRQRLRALR